MTHAPLASPRLSRRAALVALVGAAGAAVAAPAGGLRAQPVRTPARIVIAGGGAAGLTAASCLAERLDGARIIVIEPKRDHWYQPGFTLIGAGVRPAGYAVLSNRAYMPRGVDWVQASVAAFDPAANAVVTDAGETIAYDYLIVATGLTLDYEAIEGMSPDLIGREGIASVYAGPTEAATSWEVLQRFAETGGVGLFGRPATEMKCAGAPLKQTFLADDRLRLNGARGRAEIIYNAHSKALFSVPVVSERVEGLYARQDIRVNRSHVLVAIDPGRRIATYATPDGQVELKWDYLNVVPPMRAPAAVRASDLPWQEGPWAADGWMEVDKATMRHLRHPNVFGIGDVAGVPKGKTAASVKWHTPVAVEHIVADLGGTTSTAAFNGYTSCPLITRIGAAMLVEFDYDDNLTPSFPFIDPLKEHWAPWVIKEKMLKAAYSSMLRGVA